VYGVSPEVFKTLLLRGVESPASDTGNKKLNPNDGNCARTFSADPSIRSMFFDIAGGGGTLDSVLGAPKVSTQTGQSFQAHEV
jgi:hypothetical protein